MPEEIIRRKRRLSSFQIIILGFAGVILLGALLLMLPISTTGGNVTPFNETLFTATSAVCVTGLVVQDKEPFHMKNILLIGTGRFGRHIAVQLSQLGHQVMAVDTNEERISDVLPYVTNAQIGDSTNAEFLRSLGIGNFDVCIVTISDNFQNSLETTSLLKELGAKCVVSRAERDVQAKFLLRNGADHVVYPEKQVAKWAAIRYTADHIFDYIEIDEQHAIFEVEVPKSWVGKSIGELNIRRKFGINILGIKHSGKTEVSITPDTVLSGEITILALGEYKALQKCFRI